MSTPRWHTTSFGSATGPERDGSIPVDGTVILAEFDNRTDAESVLERITAVERGHRDLLTSTPVDNTFYTISRQEESS